MKTKTRHLQNPDKEYLLTHKLRWPPSVYILQSGLFPINGKVGELLNGYPQSITGWVDFEISTFLTQEYGKFKIKQYTLLFDTWMRAWHKLYPTYNAYNPTETRRQRVKSFYFTRFDHYNATWCLLGYTNNQTEKALELFSLFQDL